MVVGFKKKKRKLPFLLKVSGELAADMDSWKKLALRGVHAGCPPPFSPCNNRRNKFCCFAGTIFLNKTENSSLGALEEVFPKRVGLFPMFQVKKGTALYPTFKRGFCAKGVGYGRCGLRMKGSILY